MKQRRSNEEQELKLGSGWPSHGCDSCEKARCQWAEDF